MWIRPPRVATFIPSGDLSAGFRMMENHCQTWGGRGNIIVPFAGKTDHDGNEVPEIDDRFKPIVSAFDPDHLSVYNWTWRSHEMANPSESAKSLRQEAEILSVENEDSVEDWERFLRQDRIHRSIEMPLELGKNTLDWAAERLACFKEYSDPVKVAPAKAEEEPNDELLGIAERLGQPIVRIVSPDLSAFSIEAQLMAAGWLGSISPRYGDYLKKRGVDIIRPAVSEEHLPDLLNDVMKGRGWRPYDGVANTYHPASRNRGQPLPEYFSDSFFDNVPFACTMRGTDQVHLISPKWERRPLPVIVGSGIANFSLAIAADRLLGGAVWLPLDPTTALNDEQRAITKGIVKAIHTLTNERQNDAVRLVTMSDIDLNAVEGSLWDNKSGIRMMPPESDDTAGKALWSIPPMRVRGKEDLSRSSVEPFLNNVMATRLEPVVPIFADTDNVSAVHWVVEASIEKFHAPRRSALAACLLANDEWERGEVRASTDGISFDSHHLGIVYTGASLRDALARPRIRTPRARQIVDALLEKNELRAAPSAAGLFTSHTLDLWGGLEPLAQDLLNPAVRAVLDAYLMPTPKNASDDPHPGCFLRGSGRRFLSFIDMTSLAMADPALRRTVDTLAERQVLRRGLILKCSQCLYVSWYTAEVVGQKFVCERCTTNQTIMLDSWRDPVEEPLWFYDLAEVVYQAFNHNAQIPVLALQLLKDRSRFAFDFTTDLDIFRDDKLIDEIDFTALVDGEVLVGEAKKANTLSDEGTKDQERQAVAKLVEVADKMTADKIVVATASPGFKPETTDHLKTEAGLKGIEVEVMTSIGKVPATI